MADKQTTKETAPVESSPKRGARFRVVHGSLSFGTHTVHRGETTELTDEDAKQMLALGVVERV